MGTCTLDWDADRGFELELDLTDGELSIRFATVPVNADGTAELERGVELDRLDILFKANVELQGDPAQLLDARIVLVRTGHEAVLQLDARCEDVETGQIIPFQGRVPVALPAGVPVAGGPRPVPTNEDDLDWDDETTLEQMVVNAPETAGRQRGDAEDDVVDDDEAPAEPGRARGLQALLKALAEIDGDSDTEGDGDSDGEADAEEPEPAPKAAAATRKAPSKAPPTKAPAAKAPAAKAPAGKAPATRAADAEPEREAGDQSLGAKGEARSLLDLLVNGDHLEVEDDTDLDELAAGVARLLARPGSAERKAERLSEWLLAQEGVADLYIGDDDLAELLEKW
jgi:hypothetical protein